MRNGLIRGSVGGGRIRPGEINGINPAVMERRRDQCGVTAGTRQLCEIFRSTNAPPRNQHGRRARDPYTFDHLEIETPARADARQVENDDRTDTPVRCAGRQEMRRFVVPQFGFRGDDRFAVSQVEAEGDVPSPYCVADFLKHIERRERLKADDETCSAVRKCLVRLIHRRHAGVEPERRAECGKPGDKQALWGAPEDSIQIGCIQLGQMEAVQVGASERDRVAGLDGAFRDFFDWPVVLPLTRDGMDDLPVEQIEDTDYLHRCCSNQTMTVPE